MHAEAQAECESRLGVEREESPGEAQGCIVQRFGDERIRPVPCDIRCEGQCPRAHERVGRAEIARRRVAEYGPLAETRLCPAQALLKAEHGPGGEAHAAFGCRRAECGEQVRIPEGSGSRWLKAVGVVRRGRKVVSAGRQVDEPLEGTTRTKVPRCVVGRRDGDPGEPEGEQVVAQLFRTDIRDIVHRAEERAVDGHVRGRSPTVDVKKDSPKIAEMRGPLPAVIPPSTVSTVPVIQLASLEARNATADAMSSGVPTRPSG